MTFVTAIRIILISAIGVSAGCATTGVRARGNENVVQARIRHPKKMWYQLQTTTGDFVSAAYARKRGVRFVLPEIPPSGSDCLRIMDEYGTRVTLGEQDSFTNPAWWAAAEAEVAATLDVQQRALAQTVVNFAKAGYPEVELIENQAKAVVEAPVVTMEEEAAPEAKRRRRAPVLEDCSPKPLPTIEGPSEACALGSILEDRPDGPVVVFGPDGGANSKRLLLGDRVLGVGGRLTPTTRDVEAALKDSEQETLVVVVERLTRPVRLALPARDADDCPIRSPIPKPKAGYTNRWVRRGSMVFIRLGGSLTQTEGTAGRDLPFGALHQELGIRMGAWTDHPTVHPVIEVSAILQENLTGVGDFSDDFSTDTELGGRVGMGLRYVFDARTSITTIPWASTGILYDQVSIEEDVWWSAGIDVGYNTMGAIGWGFVTRLQAKTRSFDSVFIDPRSPRTVLEASINLELMLARRRKFARRMAAKEQRAASEP